MAVTCCSHSSFLFSLHDQRIKTGEDKGYGYVIGPDSRQLNIFHDTDETLRYKFTALSFGSLINGFLLEIPFRLMDYITLGPLQRGIEDGIHRYKCELLQNRSPRYFSLLAYSILRSFASDILKIVTYPFYLIARQFAILWGLLFPLDGLYMMSLLQEKWAVDNRATTRWSSCRDFRPFCIALRRFMYQPAYCMLSKQFIRKNNLYATLNEYHPQTTKSLYLQTLNLINRYAPYFEYDNRDRGLSLPSLGEAFASIKQEMKYFSPSMHEEQEKRGNHYPIIDQRRMESNALEKARILDEALQGTMNKKNRSILERINQQELDAKEKDALQALLQGRLMGYKVLTIQKLKDKYILKAFQAYRLRQLQTGLQIILSHAEQLIEKTDRWIGQQRRKENRNQWVFAFHRVILSFLSAYQESEKDWISYTDGKKWREFVEKYQTPRDRFKCDLLA